MVDSGAAFSLFPLSGLHCVHDGTPLQPCTTNAILSSIGGGKLSIVGSLFLSLDLGFSKLFSFSFHVTDQLNYGILGADFLSHHRLNVNMALQRLSETVEIDRCIPDEPYSEPSAYKISSDSESNCNLLNDMQQEFPEVFDCNKRKHFVKHSVIATVETSTETPIHSASRRLSPEQYKALKSELTRLLDQGILERSQSPWTSPIVMVKKKTGDWRLCADFTNLNKVLDMQKYTLPNINDFAALAHDCKWFSALDVADAYYNIPVDPRHRHKLTIATPLGNYCYNYLPMGLASSSCYYQRLMNEAISNIPQVFCYLDDIIIMSKNLKEHRQTLRQVFARLRDHGLVVKASKCVVAAQNLSFLGYHVSSAGISLPNKVAAIREFKLPHTKKQLRTYLGMYQFYAHFVRGSSQWLQPLYNLVASSPPKKPILWDDAHIKHFEESKDALADATQLAFPDPDADTELVTDASGNSIGCVLQQAKNGVTTPLAFWSKGLTQAQRNWSVFEKELFACYASLRHFRYYLEAKDFVLRTDHRPIVAKFYSNTRASSPRQERFFDFISQMTNRVEYVKGERNVADLFSRPVVSAHSDLNSILPDPESFVVDYMEMATEQHNDQEVQNLKNNNGTGLRLEEVLLSDTGLTILCDNSQGRLRPVIPKSMRFAVFRHFHSTSHPGVRAGIKLISRLVVWYDMRRDITRWTRECQQCARSKVYRHTKAPLQIVMPPPKGRFTHIYVDLTGPLPSSKGYTYIMVIIDRFSRFFQAVPLTGITADECINAFIRHWVSLFGCPEHIYTDRGKQFTSNLWLKMCHHLGSKSHQSTAYHPQAQGIVERLNRTLKTSLKCQEDASQWYDRLPWVMLALRNMPKQDLSDSTPSELVFGQPVRLPGEFFEESSATNMPDDHFSDNLAKFIQSIKFFPSRTSNHPTYVVPALFNPATTHVYIRVDRRLPPLHPTYTGPYQVIQRHNKYFELNMRTHTERVTIDRLKPAYLSISTLNQNSSSIQSHLPTTVEVNLQTPLSNSGSPHINTPRQSSITPQTYTRRGRKINVPSRYADYETDF